VITTTLKNPLKVGDVIRIKGHTTDFVQNVGSIQIEHESVQKAKKGDGIGIKVKDIVRDNDKIFLADKKTASSFLQGTVATAPQIQPFILRSKPTSVQLRGTAAAPSRPGISINPVIPKQAFSVPKNMPPAAKGSPDKPKFLSF